MDDVWLYNKRRLLNEHWAQGVTTEKKIEWVSELEKNCTLYCTRSGYRFERRTQCTAYEHDKSNSIRSVLLSWADAYTFAVSYLLSVHVAVFKGHTCMYRYSLNFFPQLCFAMYSAIKFNSFPHLTAMCDWNLLHACNADFPSMRCIILAVMFIFGMIASWSVLLSWMASDFFGVFLEAFGWHLKMGKK